MNPGSGERPQVAVIFGGTSPEHAVSVRSARSILSAIDRERWAPLPFAVTRHGVWLRPVESAQRLKEMDDGAPEALNEAAGEGALARPQALEALAACDLAFPVIHGPTGENGALQGLLELAGLPYVGAGIAASAVGMDKHLMKALFRQAGLPVVRHVVLTAHDWERDASGVERAAAAMGYPQFIKPANGGSSIGVSKVESREDVGAALVEAFHYDHKVLVEAGVRGREIECAVLGNQEPEASPPGEIRPRRAFYDYTAKYADPSTELIVPADLPDTAARRVRELSLAAFRAIDCRGMARVDFLVEEDGTPWVSEINTIPGFTSVSMYPRLWEAAGLPYPALLTRLLDLALEWQAEEGRHGG